MNFVQKDFLRKPHPSIFHTQPKTNVVGKLCKTLKNDTTFEFQLNLRRARRFLWPLSPPNPMLKASKYSVSLVFALTATLKGGRGGGGG